MQKPHIQIIVGSVRQGRATAPLARWAEERLRRSGHWSVELIDLADWCFPQLAVARPPALGGYEDRLQSCWARTVRRADAYLIAAPEYNHGYPGVLKTALDYIYAEWRGKPVSCLAFGNAEGARMVEAIQQVFIELGMIPVAPATHIRMAHAKLREGRFTSDERDDAALDRTGAQLLSWCERLRVSGDRPEHSPAYAAAARVLVLGLGAEAIQSVVEPLRRCGIEASGMVLPESIDHLPDPMRLDLISFGRGALGPVSERFKDELCRRNPELRFVDTILPLAIRQIEAALAERAGTRTHILSSQLSAVEGKMSVDVVLREPSRTGLTQYMLQDGITAHRIATLELPEGRTELTFPCRQTPGSLVIDADGAEFRHHVISQDVPPRRICQAN